MIADGVMPSYWFHKMATIHVYIVSQIYFRFFGLATAHIKEGLKLSAYQILTRLSQSTAEVLLLPVSENERPPY